MTIRSVALLMLQLVLLSSPASADRPKTDMVMTDSGDVVYCEILQMVQGQLKAKTHDMGTIQIKWNNVVALRSNYFYRVEVQHLGRRFGNIGMTENEDSMIIRWAGDTLRVNPRRVVEITPIEKNFWSRFDGSLSLGFSYTKASKIAQLTMSWTNKYRTERDLFTLNAQTIVTSAEGNDNTSRNEDFTLTYYRLMRQVWNGSVSAATQRNDELGLKRRYIFGATVGANPLKSNLQTLLVSLGAAYNLEQGAAESAKVVTSVEGLAKAVYSLYKYSSPKADLNTSITYFPSFTEPGRHRIDFSLKGRYELVSDFFIELSYYTNYDSRPATEDASHEDFGLVTSISWTY